jgi:hypothetical protein
VYGIGAFYCSNMQRPLGDRSFACADLICPHRTDPLTLRFIFDCGYPDGFIGRAHPGKLYRVVELQNVHILPAETDTDIATAIAEVLPDGVFKGKLTGSDEEIEVNVKSHVEVITVENDGGPTKWAHITPAGPIPRGAKLVFLPDTGLVFALPPSVPIIAAVDIAVFDCDESGRVSHTSQAPRKPGSISTAQLLQYAADAQATRRLAVLSVQESKDHLLKVVSRLRRCTFVIPFVPGKVEVYNAMAVYDLVMRVVYSVIKKLESMP